MSDEIIKPTVKQLSDAYCEGDDDDDFTEVDQTSDPTWRHGCYMTTVYHRLSDDTYWQVRWRRGDNDDYNSLRECEINDDDIMQVEPYEVVKTAYRAVK